MCGIAGIIAPDSERYRSHVGRMVAALRHRGPDGSAASFLPGCALGHTRLSIVDLTSGDQPMFSTDGRLALTFNGEIYGYREIRKGLSDYPFQTTSDTEVILALHQRHGTRLLSHLPGMFAFALWDQKERVLFAARDRFGEKPFYYAWGEGGEFLFASEIKSLLASGLLRPKLNRESLTHYLRHLYVHPQQTIYSNVFVLPPAHYLTLEGNSLKIEKYWRLPETAEPLSEREAVDEFKRLFEQAVERQLVADVPVGAFLSGGLDSSSIVAAASRYHPRLKTFSFGFRDSTDELPFAREIAELYGTEHTELLDQQLDLADLLHKMAEVYDEPFADSSNVPTYLISQSARRFGKVVLTGDGGDELLGGYNFWYRSLWAMEQGAEKSLPVSLLRFAARVSSRLQLSKAADRQQALQGALMRQTYRTIKEAHAAQNVYFDRDELHQIGMNGQPAPALSNNSAQPRGTVDDALRMDLSDYMPGDILVKTDRASMAHGLELRAPFLDVDFASFCISLPGRMKITARQDKWILRRCYSEDWPQSIRARDKCGFGAPVHHWLKQEGLVHLKRRILDSPKHSLFSLIPFAGSRQFASKDNYQTWILLMLGLWLEHGGEDSL
jgi:asparagine synthase (glutamine-hydrolysing)